MENHEEPAPQGLWDDIERSIGQQRPQPVPLYKRVMLWTAGMGVAAAAAVAIAFFIGNHRSEPLSPALSQQPQLAMQQEKPRQSAPGQVAPAAPEKEAYLAVNTYQPAPHAVAVMNAERANAVRTENQPEPEPDQRQGEQPAGEEAPPQQKRQPVRSVLRSAKDHPAVAAPQVPALRKHGQRFSASFYAANLPHSSKELNNYSELVAGTTLPRDITTEQSAGKAPVKDIIYSNLGKKIQTHTKHRLPVRFGLSFRYRFNDRWSIESGLTYTYLSADLTSGSADNYYNSEQRLQYLGIPLQVNFDFWKNRHWNLYASAGGSMDKCIHGRLDTDYVLDNQLTSSDSRSIMEKPVQFSVNGALGAQWNITDRFGLYAEPGVAYHFDNGSPIETIYKDKPFNFNFKLGVRLTFD